jgi:hypothetical protein
MLSFWLIFVVKKYVLLCFVPGALLWVYASRLFRIKSLVVKALVIPVVVAAMIGSGYLAIVKIGEDDPRYSIDQLAATAMITAYDIGFYTGRDAGSGYVLGELDGTFRSMLRLAPQAINVTLFRPYLWEVKNPLMLLTALEAMGMIFLLVWTIFRQRLFFFRSLAKPDVLFCIVFSLTFAFAVGVSTFNFGTLARYKIPLLPFFIIGLAIINGHSTRRNRQH